MSKSMIEGKLSNWIRICIYKHVQNIKNKDSQTLWDRDEVTRGMGLAPPLRTMQQCRALKPGRVKLRSQVEPVGWPRVRNSHIIRRGHRT
jgi:hypothetical protein